MGSDDSEKADEAAPRQAPLPAVVAVLLAMIVFVLYRSELNVADVPGWVNQMSAPHKVPAPAAGKNEIVVQFCQSWGTGENFKDLKKMIQADTANKLTVKPAEYPPAPIMLLMADCVMMGQLSLVLAIFFHNKSLPKKMRDSWVVTIFAIWLGGSMVSSALTKTGAFEVYFEQNLIFSAVSEHRTPTMQDMIEGFKAVGVAIKAL